MKKTSKNISVLIPNYNGKKLLQKYLDSVLEELAHNDQLVIVDDASSDSSVSYLVKRFDLQTASPDFVLPHSAEYFPQEKDIDYNYYSGKLQSGKKKIIINLLSLHKNMRFAAAVNAGVLLVKNPSFLLINTDVKLTKGCRKALLSKVSPEMFAVGCLEFEDSIDGLKSGKNKLWFSKGMFEHSKAEDMTSGSTAWVSGGSGLFSTEKWFQLNGFDQLFYPAYWEDIDISFRAKKMGWNIWFESEAVVVHKHETTNIDVYGKQKMLEMSWKNADAFVLKNGNLLQKILHYIWKPYWKYKRSRFLKSKVEL